MLDDEDLEALIDDAYDEGLRTPELPLDWTELGRAALATAICAVESSLCPFAGFIDGYVAEAIGGDA